MKSFGKNISAILILSCLCLGLTSCRPAYTPDDAEMETARETGISGPAAEAWEETPRTANGSAAEFPAESVQEPQESGTVQGEKVVWTGSDIPLKGPDNTLKLVSSSYEWSEQEPVRWKVLASLAELEQELEICSWKGTVSPDHGEGRLSMEKEELLEKFKAFPFDGRALCLLRLELPSGPMYPEITEMRLAERQLTVTCRLHREKAGTLRPVFEGVTVLAELPADQARQVTDVNWILEDGEETEKGEPADPDAQIKFPLRIYTLHPKLSNEEAAKEYEEWRARPGIRFRVIRSYEELEELWADSLAEEASRGAAFYRDDSVEMDPNSSFGEYHEVTLKAFLEEYEAFPFEEKQLCLLFGHKANTPTRFRVCSCVLEDGCLTLETRVTVDGLAEALYPYTAFVEVPSDLADSITQCREIAAP